MRYINDIISSGNIKKLKNDKGQTIENVMKANLQQQAVYLQELINKYLLDYRKRFFPKKYKRTGDLENSVSISSKVKVENNKLITYVYFNENALHRSGFGVWSLKKGRGKYDDDIQDFEDPRSTNVALLINYGYRVKSPVWFRNKMNFGYRKGNGFVQKAINEFNKTNSMGIYIDYKKDVITTREW